MGSESLVGSRQNSLLFFCTLQKNHGKNAPRTITKNIHVTVTFSESSYEVISTKSRTTGYIHVLHRNSGGESGGPSFCNTFKES